MESNILGKGTFGSVRRDQDVAIKQFSLENKEYQEETFIIESTICEYLANTHIIKCLDYNFDKSEISMQLGIPTLRYINASPKHLRSAIDSLIAAVEYMHSMGLLHLDIKPENTIIVDNRLKLLDFGASSYIGPHLILKNTSFAPGYRPPELYERDCEAYPSLDIWATGMTIYHLLTGDILEIQENFVQTLSNVEFLNDNEYYHKLLEPMLAITPENRYMNGKKLVPLQLLPSISTVKRIPDRSQEISIINWIIEKFSFYKISMHALFLTVKIFYTALDIDNVWTFLLACMKLGEILTNPWTIKFKYKTLFFHSKKDVKREDIPKAVEKILQDTNYNIRSADSFLYFNEYLVKQNYDYEPNPNTFIKKLYYLMMYDGSLFTLDPSLIFDTFFAMEE